MASAAAAASGICTRAPGPLVLNVKIWTPVSSQRGSHHRRRRCCRIYVRGEASWPCSSSPRQRRREDPSCRSSTDVSAGEVLRLVPGSCLPASSSELPLGSSSTVALALPPSRKTLFAVAVRAEGPPASRGAAFYLGRRRKAPVLSKESLLPRSGNMVRHLWGGWNDRFKACDCRPSSSRMAVLEPRRRRRGWPAPKTGVFRGAGAGPPRRGR